MALFARRRAGRFITPADKEIETLLAAAEAVRLQDGEQYRRTLPDWQRQALEFYDLVGEAWYPAQFYARMLSRLRLYPARERPNNEMEEIQDEQAQLILQRIQARRWLPTYGRLQFLIGDGYLTVSLDEDGFEQWEYLSPAELIVQERSFLRRVGAGLPPREYRKVESLGPGDSLAEGEMKAWRLWWRHPTHSKLADSPMKSVLGLLQQLMHLDKAATAQAISRIVGTGLLIVDDRITIPGADAEAGDENDDDPFMRRLLDYMVRPLSQPGSAASQAPLVARVEPVEGMPVREMVHYLRFHDPNQTTDWETKVEKTITRIAISLDMPPEELLGLSQANQWTAWAINEDRWKAHGESLAIALCDDLTYSYFRPACIAAGIRDAEHLAVWFDPAQVVTHPDRGKSANEVHDRGALSDEALRQAHNFSEMDAPSPEERAVWEAIKLRFPPRPKDKPEEIATQTGSHVEPGPPEGNGGSRRTAQPSPQPDGQRLRALGAAEVMLERLRERAGSVIRTKRASCEECFKGMEQVSNAELAAKLGRDVVRSLGITSELALVSGGAEVFSSRLVSWGYDDYRAKVIAGVLERIAAETLYEEHAELPPAFVGEL